MLRGGLRERQDHNLFRCRRRLRGRVSADTATDPLGTGVCRDPRNASRGQIGACFFADAPKFTP